MFVDLATVYAVLATLKILDYITLDYKDVFQELRYCAKCRPSGY